MDLGKVIGFKFKTLNKAYENFVTKRKKDKEKQVKIKSKNREKQIKEEQKKLKETPSMQKKVQEEI